MSLFAAAANTRATQLPSTNILNPLQWFTNWAGGGQTSSGISVNEDNMVSLSAVFNAITLLSETVAQQPLSPYLEYEQEGLTKRRKYKEHPTYRLVAYEAFPGFMTAFTWRKLMMNHVCRWQNAYSFIERNGNYKPVSIIPIHPTRVVSKIRGGSLYYEIADIDMTIPAQNMIHLVGFNDDGINGKSLASLAKEGIGHALAVEKFGSDYFGKGINVSGFIESPDYLGKDQDKVERLKASFVQKYGGQNGQFGVGVLEGGAQWKPNETNPEQAQLKDTRKFNVEEVARWLNVPVPLLKQIDKLTYNNAEQVDIQFTKYTISPWNVNIEQELWRKLLSETEKSRGDIYFKHNMNGLLRGDTQSRAKLYDTLSKAGAASPNFILEKEDENPYVGGDVHVVNPGAITIEQLQNQNNGNTIPNG